MKMKMMMMMMRMMVITVTMMFKVMVIAVIMMMMMMVTIMMAVVGKEVEAECTLPVFSLSLGQPDIPIRIPEALVSNMRHQQKFKLKSRYLRESLHLTGTKISCGQGGCGSCLVTAKVVMSWVHHHHHRHYHQHQYHIFKSFLFLENIHQVPDPATGMKKVRAVNSVCTTNITHTYKL